MSDVPVEAAPVAEEPTAPVVEGSQIVETPVVDDSPLPAHGTEVVSPAGNTERIIWEHDEAGNFTGWHKEHVSPEVSADQPQGQ